MNTPTIQLEQYRSENEALRETVVSLGHEVATLKEQLAWFQRQLFGKRSEKEKDPAVPETFLPYFENLGIQEEPSKTRTVAAHTRKVVVRDGKDAITLPSDLPVETQVIDIPEKEKICQETGLPLVKIGEEVTQKLAHRPGSFYIKQIIRPKYALPQESSGGIRTAELPDSLLTRCFADESFLAEILIRKFIDHLPLYRLSEIFARDGVKISRQNLCKWVIRAGQALKPIYDEMIRCVLQSENVFIDETPLDMQDPGNGKTKQVYMWVLVGGKGNDPPLRIYAFRTSRQHVHAEKLLENFKGAFHSDKYEAYMKIASNKDVTWCPCFVHIRRKFIEAESGDQEFRNWVLRKIRYLFMFERVAWNRSPEERLRIRQKYEEPIIDELVREVNSKLHDGKVLPKSKYREALFYFSGLIPFLKNYLRNPFSRLDNNVAERAVRCIAIGRKNWLFVGNEGGGEAAAVIFSIVQTCKAIGINPREYLEDVMRRLMGHSAKRISELLPNNWSSVKIPQS